MVNLLDGRGSGLAEQAMPGGSGVLKRVVIKFGPTTDSIDGDGRPAHSGQCIIERTPATCVTCAREQHQPIDPSRTGPCGLQRLDQRVVQSCAIPDHQMRDLLFQRLAIRPTRFSG